MKNRKFAAGIMRWGAWGANKSLKSYQQTIEFCMESGINLFDHADIYGGYTTEKEFGDAIHSMKLERADYQLITKCGIRLVSPNRPDNYIKSYSNTPEYIIKSVENSLSNLKTDYIDLLLIHRPSPLMEPGQIASTVEKLKQSGKILSFGVSNYLSGKMDLLKDAVQIDCNQIEISLAQLSPFTDGSVDYCMKTKISIMAWGTLGLMAEAQMNKEYRDRMGRLETVAQKYGWTYSQMAYLFLFHHPAGIVPVLGTTRIERIREALEVLNMEISDQQWFEIWSASTGREID